MANTLALAVISPEKTLFAGPAEYVHIPGKEGEFGVLPGHMPLISTLREGVVTVEAPDGEKKEFSVKSGIAEVTPDSCRLLVEAA